MKTEKVRAAAAAWAAVKEAEEAAWIAAVKETAARSEAAKGGFRYVL